jgi:hypothetical protein
LASSDETQWKFVRCGEMNLAEIDSHIRRLETWAHLCRQLMAQTTDERLALDAGLSLAQYEDALALHYRHRQLLSARKIAA